MAQSFFSATVALLQAHLPGLTVREVSIPGMFGAGATPAIAVILPRLCGANRQALWLELRARTGLPVCSDRDMPLGVYLRGEQPEQVVAKIAEACAENRFAGLALDMLQVAMPDRDPQMDRRVRAERLRFDQLRPTFH